MNEQGRVGARPGAPAASDQATHASCPPLVVEACGLGKRFTTGPRVLNAIDFSARRGERIALVGSNGAGKSTFLRCLVGLVPFGDGTVEVLGQRFSEQPNRRQRVALRRRLGFVFQFHGLVGRTSALSNVVNGALGQGNGWRAWNHALAPERLRTDALDALAAVGLSDRALDRTDTLSGGQSQRVAIARALVHRPELVIADEPAASLDPVAGAEVMSVFHGLAEQRGATLIFTTHDLQHALDYSDRIVALAAGHVVLDSPTVHLRVSDLEAIYRD